MGLTFKVTRNDISPKLSAMAAAAKNPEPVFRAMGTTFMSLTMGNFNDAGSEYRPKPWANKKDGTPSKLQKSGTLARSFHLEASNTFAKVSNPTIYAATHQFGSEKSDQQAKAAAAKEKSTGAQVSAVTRNIPARPFFPVENGKLTPKAEEKLKAAGERALKRQLGE